ncbi:ParB N-terminal domain-containing protein [uncultured Anaerococcus sp.]|uniref:ParB N-terminal domain-containing protein n=1 Tax=uncultured Anaerococcus sp. TaxID=293428 RepID=UPI00288C534C|nr:ParB N-terminal domain-containing protein [uncultured Anaerococcus sp.]
MDKKEINIVYKSVEELIPYVNNPRDNANAVDAVASSIKNFGFKVPIVIDKGNEIVTGHTRLLAAKKLGMDEVPVIIADDLTEAEVKAFRLADNKVGELADWDWSLLDSEFEELKEMDLDFDMEEFGFIDNDVLDMSYIDELDENGLSMTKGENDHFSMSFVFPIEKEELINEYIEEVGKEKVVEDIILRAEGLKDA